VNDGKRIRGRKMMRRRRRRRRKTETTLSSRCESYVSPNFKPY
jgi:hypothetical protein